MAYAEFFVMLLATRWYGDELPAKEEGSVAGHLAAQSQDGALRAHRIRPSLTLEGKRKIGREKGLRSHEVKYAMLGTRLSGWPITAFPADCIQAHERGALS